MSFLGGVYPRKCDQKASLRDDGEEVDSLAGERVWIEASVHSPLHLFKFGESDFRDGV